jgi:iron complex outermembrane receptor protein
VRLGGLCAVIVTSTAANGWGQSVGPTSKPSSDQAQTTTAAEQAPTTFKKMSLDELLNVEVTTVSREPERLSDAASAIQVITGDEIESSGAVTLPEALELAPNLDVAQVSSHNWAISSRGFNGAPLGNNTLSDKLLVMIDGRTVYTPLFGGVFWDVQNVMLEDVDRIEVVSGPGGTLWGANAVNGVINVVSKSARDTQGLYASGAGGSFLQDAGAVRYGGSIGSNLFYRVYVQRLDYDSTKFSNGTSADDAWNMTQSGMRMDYYPSSGNTLTLQGDVYGGNEGQPVNTKVDGENVIGRWTHVFSPGSDMSVQMYFDDTGRQVGNDISGDTLRTYDIDFQDRFPVGERDNITWGLGYRFMADHVQNFPGVAFIPANEDMQLFSGFVQDEIKIVPDKLKFTIGSKVEHNDFSGYEVEPSVRLAWTPTARQTIWGAVSRAVRSPSRFDTQEVFTDLSTPNEQFVSENVLAYELGYRIRPIDNLSISVAPFYNQYTDIRSLNFNPTVPGSFIFANDQKAESWGLELSADAQIMDWWRLRGGYTYFGKNITATSAGVVPGTDVIEGNDPNNQVMLQSIMNLPHHWQFGVVGRYVDSLPAPHVPAYFSLDARLSWQYNNFEFAVVGQNLLSGRHMEFGSDEIPRSVYGKITYRW